MSTVDGNGRASRSAPESTSARVDERTRRSAYEANERVMRAFVCDRRFLHVAGQHARIVWQAVQALANARQQQLGIAAGQVSAADRLAKQSVPAEEQVRIGCVQRKRPWRGARRVDDAQR